MELPAGIAVHWVEKLHVIIPVSYCLFPKEAREVV